MKPLIGISMNLEKQAARDLNVLDLDYGRAVAQAGGIPVPILGIDESLADLVKHLNGFIFSGGDDIHPRFYSEKILPGACTKLSPDERTVFEKKLFASATKARKPILAICHGAQLVNVALGGRLFQDLAVQIRKADKHGPARTGEKVFHRVDVLEGTKLHHIMGVPSIRVRSSHHQSVKNPGRGLRLSAVAHDRVVEALESRSDHFVMAVQWHPEKTLNDTYTKKLFKYFINASAK